MEDRTFQFEGAPDGLLAWLALGIAAALCASVWRRRAVSAGSSAGASASRPLRRDCYTAAGLFLAWLLLGTRLGWAAAAFVLMLAAAALRFYPIDRGNVAGADRRQMLALRVLLLLMLALLLLRPVWTARSSLRPRPRVAVLIDQSRSLLQRDPEPRSAEGIRRRVNAVRDAIDDCGPSRRELSAHADLTLTGFAARCATLSDWTVSADGDATGIAAALRSTVVPDDPPSAVVLISDGAENVESPEAALAAARQLSELGVAVQAVGVGGETPIGDAPTVHITRLAAPSRMVAGNAAEVQFDVAAADCAGRALRIELLWNDDVIATRDWTPGAPRESATLSGRHSPRTPGFARVTARAAAVEPRGPRGERPSAERCQFVHVESGGVAVLLIESHPRHETVFLRRALASDPRFRVESVYLARPAEGKWGNPLPRTVEEWARYRLVIVGDVPRRELLRAQAESLLEAVAQRGVGLIALGGLRRMEWLRTEPLRDLAPALFDDRAADLRDVSIEPAPTVLRQFSIASAASAPANSDAPVQPNARTAIPPALEDWRGMPPMPTANRLGALKPTAETWLTDADGDVLGAAIQAGAGRVAAIGFDGAWRFAMHSDRGAELHRRLWRQLALLVADLRPNAYIRSDEPRYVLQTIQSGQRPIAIEARIADPLGGVSGGWVVSAWLEGPLDEDELGPAADDKSKPTQPPRSAAGRRAATRQVAAPDAATQSAASSSPAAAPRSAVALLPSGERWTGHASVTRSGVYRLLLEARPGGGNVSGGVGGGGGSVGGGGGGGESSGSVVRAENRFVVVSGDPERDQPAADLALLRNLADATAEVGGRYYPIERLGACLQQVMSLDRRAARTVELRTDPAADLRSPLLTVMLVLLAGEWIIRRRRGFI